jgi:hypothetical protein
MKNYKEITRKEFYTIMKDINWNSDIEEIQECFESSLYYCKPLKLYYKLKTIHFNECETSLDLMEVTQGTEDTKFFIERNY